MIAYSIKPLSISILVVFLAMPLAKADEYTIVIFKKAGQLVLKKDNVVIKKYAIATGKGGGGTKYQRGDNKTPVGRYRAVSLKDSRRFHYFIQLDYPNLADAWHGYKNQVIDAKEFKMIAAAYKNHQLPPQNTQLGGLIGIHGLGKTTSEKLDIHRQYNWTEGCIALTNNDIDNLKRYIEIGTSIIIKE